MFNHLSSVTINVNDMALGLKLLVLKDLKYIVHYMKSSGRCTVAMRIKKSKYMYMKHFHLIMKIS